MFSEQPSRSDRCQIPSFQDINEDKENGQPKFAVFDIVLGVIYTAACVVELFGVIAAATVRLHVCLLVSAQLSLTCLLQQQRLALIRIYAILSTIASVLFVGAGFLRVVIHFAFKVRVFGRPFPQCTSSFIRRAPAQNGLLDECEKVTQGEGVEFVSRAQQSSRVHSA